MDKKSIGQFFPVDFTETTKYNFYIGLKMMFLTSKGKFDFVSHL